MNRSPGKQDACPTLHLQFKVLINQPQTHIHQSLKRSGSARVA